MNIAQWLVRAAHDHPQAPALAWGRSVLHHHGNLARHVSAMGAGLWKLGLSPGDRVGLVMRNHPAYWESLLAIWYAGLVAVPIHSQLHPRELAYIFSDAGTPVVIAHPSTLSACEQAAAVCPEVRHVIDVASANYRRLAQVEPMAVVAREPSDLAWLFYTSGTTGRPKGVMLSHHNLRTMCGHYFADVDTIAVRDCVVHAAPMSHGSGLYALPHLAQAACNVVPESGGFDAQELFDLGTHWQGITLFAAPTMLKRLVEAPSDDPFSGLKTLVYGGGPMYVADIQAAMSRFGPRFAQIYGQGESPMSITVSPKAIHQDLHHPRRALRLASVGRAFVGLEVRVMNEQDQQLPVGEIGEVCVRGPVVMQGYWRNPAASAQTLRNGWLHTGDMGCLDKEGFLTLKDRSKDLIISGGSNIYPREVEEVLLLHPDVSEVSVVGHPHPDWGEEVVAFVVLRPQSLTQTAQTLHNLDEHCLQHMARFKRPKHYRVVSQLPKNETGKVLKTELRQLLHV
ncbi:MAG: long-chain fatty acid--CoA ligase [Betaproteobacteria bacterium]|nr:long-chain fatty acid--CoA ligase [Betaproteobacteria bacterium]